jgi:hypothetical protein
VLLCCCCVQLTNFTTAEGDAHAADRREMAAASHARVLKSSINAASHLMTLFNQATHPGSHAPGKKSAHKAAAHARASKLFDGARNWSVCAQGGAASSTAAASPPTNADVESGASSHEVDDEKSVPACAQPQPPTRPKRHTLVRSASKLFARSPSMASFRSERGSVGEVFSGARTTVRAFLASATRSVHWADEDSARRQQPTDADRRTGHPPPLHGGATVRSLFAIMEVDEVRERWRRRAEGAVAGLLAGLLVGAAAGVLGSLGATGAL